MQKSCHELFDGIGKVCGALPKLCSDCNQCHFYQLFMFFSYQDTMIKYMTDGCMLREILADPSLSQYSVVILDEAHERSLNTVCGLNICSLWFYLNEFSYIFGRYCIYTLTISQNIQVILQYLGFFLSGILIICRRYFTKSLIQLFVLQDVLLGLLKKTLSKGSRGRKTTLKVIVMSATLETEKLSSFYENCPVFTIPGRIYPVKETFCNLIGPKDKDSSVYVKEVCWDHIHYYKQSVCRETCSQTVNVFCL